MKSILYLVFAALAIGINAAPTHDAAPERTYISYAALAADRIPGSGGAASQANPYNRGCTVEERCFRDTGKRSEDVEVEVMASEVSDRVEEQGMRLIILLNSKQRNSELNSGHSPDTH